MYFPPRELEVMSVLWRLGSASVAEVRAELKTPLAYTSVLSALRTLEDKGCVRHESAPEGRSYRYIATVDAKRAGKTALARIREAIFEGSAERMFAQLVSDRRIGQSELERMQRMIAERLENEE
jgi:predicted transcriptional regulator